MQYFFDAFTEKLDIYIIGLVLLSGFFQKRYFKGFCWIKQDPTYDSALKTLALSAVVSVVYIALVKDPEAATPYAKYFLSYFTATSAYELLINPFIKFLERKSADKP